MSDIFEKLAAPFPPSDIHWRVGSTNKDKTKGVALAYLDARDVMARLDDVVGPECWADSYAETQTGRIICTLSVMVDADLWVSKSDGAGDTSFEGAKGAISDAFKRAAVKWGVGRYLYYLDAPWVELQNGKYLPRNFNGSDYLSAFVSKQMKTKYWKALKEAASNDDSGHARELWDEMETEQQKEIWHDLSSGVRSAIKNLLDSTKEEAA